MELRRQLSLIRSRLRLILLCALVAGAAAYLISGALPKVYEGRVTLIVGQSLTSTNPDYNAILASQRLSQTYADLATTTPILQKVIAKSGIRVTAEEFRKLISADAPLDSTLVHITIRDNDPQRAANLANSVAGEMIAASSAITGRDSSIQHFIDQDLAATQAQIQDTETEIQRLANLSPHRPNDEQQLQILQGRLVTLRQTYATLLGFSSSSGANLLTVVDPASPPSEPASPRPLLNTALAALVGLLLATGLAFLLDYLDDTVKSPEDVETLLGLPTLGTIVRIRDVNRQGQLPATLLNPRSPAAEAYRTLRTNVEFATVDQPAKTILVTSSVPSEGKTTTAANLAVVFAQAGRRTILVDADFRRPGVHAVFDLPNVRGLSSLLRTENVPIPSVAQVTQQPDLLVITTGPLPPNPAELLASQRMRAILARIADSSDVIILDSPPLQAVADPAILASITGGTILVIDAGRTRRGAIRSAQDALTRSDTRPLGVTLNRMPERAIGGYYDYYGYGEKEEGSEPQVQSPSTSSSVKGE